MNTLLGCFIWLNKFLLYHQNYSYLEGNKLRLKILLTITFKMLSIVFK